MTNIPVERKKIESWLTGLQCGVISQRHVFEELRALLSEQPKAGAGQRGAADSDPSAPWLTLAHVICSDAGIEPGHITERLEKLRSQLAERHDQANEVRSLREALQITRDTIDGQLELIAKRAPSNWLDKIPVVRSLKAHRERCNAALTQSPKGEEE